MSDLRLGGSFRDPAGYLFERDGVLLRRVEREYADDWTLLASSGLLARLQDARLLVPHEELSPEDGAFRLIRPERIPFVSYPYEWSPSQLLAAGRLTLQVQQEALAHGMILKDASAYNVQFVGSRPVFVDTLSFTAYREGMPWAAYRQFCQHFLAPLALMRRVDPRLRELLRSGLDGVPLDLASRLLPWGTWLRPTHLLHLHLHARSVRHHEGQQVTPGVTARGVSRTGMEGLLGNLAAALDGVEPRVGRTEWSEYETDNSYSEEGQRLKAGTLDRWIAHLHPALAIDLGANTGQYSQRAAAGGAYVVAIDGDVGAVERLCARGRAGNDERVLPLWMDLTNPSPAQGWAHRERSSLAERGPADLVLALALVHHLAIGNNVPLEGVVRAIADLGRAAIVEWVPKADPQTQRLLVSRADIFPNYTEAAFQRAVGAHFVVDERVGIPDGERVLYLLRRRT